MKNITYEDNPNEFLQLCHELSIPFHKTVRHFEPDVVGIYRPVLRVEEKRKEISDGAY